MKYVEYLDSPVFWLRRAFLAMHKAVGEEMHCHGLTAAQFEVLRHLWQQDGMEQRALQERLGVSSPTLTGVLDGMVERGWLARQLSSEDARVRLLFLTSEGRALESVVGAAMERVQERLLAGFSTAEGGLLKDWLRRVSANLGVGGDSCE